MILLRVVMGLALVALASNQLVWAKNDGRVDEVMVGYVKKNSVYAHLLRKYQHCTPGDLSGADLRAVTQFFEMYRDGGILKYFSRCVSDFGKEWESYYIEKPAVFSGPKGTVAAINTMIGKVDGQRPARLKTYIGASVDDVPVWAVIDTGFPQMLAVSSDLIASQSEEGGGRKKVNIKVGEVGVSSVSAWELSFLSNTVFETKAVIGLPFLLNFKSVYFDFEGSELHLGGARVNISGDVESQYSFPIRIAGAMLVVNMSVGGDNRSFIIDTGSERAMSISGLKGCNGGSSGVANVTLSGHKGTSMVEAEECIVRVYGAKAESLEILAHDIPAVYFENAYGLANYGGHDGVIGLRFFDGFNGILFDFDKMTLTLYR